MKLVLVRHAETELNAQGRYQSRLDARLNEVGLAQARDASAALTPHMWAGVWSSPARRAAATAAALADAVGTVPRELPELCERNLGELDGQVKYDHRLASPAEAHRLENDPSFAPHGGESLTDVFARLHQALSGIVAAHDPTDRRVLVVTHGGVLNALAAHLFDDGVTSVGPVGNVRAVGLTVHDGGAGASPMRGAVHDWDVPPHVCEGVWPAAKSPALSLAPTNKSAFSSTEAFS